MKLIGQKEDLFKSLINILILSKYIGIVDIFVTNIGGNWSSIYLLNNTILTQGTQTGIFQLKSQNRFILQ